MSRSPQKMHAVFRPSATFSIQSRRLFVIAGVIESGTLKKGMLMWPQGGAGVKFRVDAVEIVTKLGGASEVALCIGYNSEQELASLQSLPFEGGLVEVEGGDENQG